MNRRLPPRAMLRRVPRFPKRDAAATPPREEACLVAVGREFRIAAVPASALRVFAHDFWIEPESFRPTVGADLGFALRVGERLEGEPIPRRPRRVRDFRLYGPGDSQEIAGDVGDDPAGRCVVEKEGLHIAVYHGNRVEIGIDAPKFEEYLREEGLERVSEDRAARGESAREGREVYSRCAKSLILSGEGPGSGHDRVVGLPFELVPIENPYALSPGDSLTVRVFFNARPLAGALVSARAAVGLRQAQQARSDAEGLVTFSLAKPGLWLIKSTHMIRHDVAEEADWESFWGSLTFQIDPR